MQLNNKLVREWLKMIEEIFFEKESITTSHWLPVLLENKAKWWAKAKFPGNFLQIRICNAFRDETSKSKKATQKKFDVCLFSFVRL